MSYQNDQSSEGFNIKDFILQALKYRYFYIASFIIAVAAAFLINKFSPVVYEVNSVIGPVEDRRTSLLESNNLFSGLRHLSEARNLENDINSLNSFSLVSATIKNLNLETGYFKEKNTLFGRARQVFTGNHYLVSIDKSHVQPINTKFYIQVLDENSFRLTVSEEKVSLYNYIDNVIVSTNHVLDIDTICHFNETISNGYFKFSVFLNRELLSAEKESDDNDYFVFYHVDQITKSYL
ncbi:MAG TPA: hypothetical protein PLO24_12000, partial [Bacteroidales bacterium]|nr:hypothetical protein [Bacteroidales bacterium]